MALSGISHTTEPSVYQPYAQSPTAVFTTAPSAAGAAPVLVKADPGSVATQPDTEDASSIIANIGANAVGTQTYNAAGLMNAAAQASQASTLRNAPAVSDIPFYEQDLTDLMVVSADDANDARGPTNNAAIYTPAGDLQDLPIFTASIRSNGGIVNTQA